MEEVFQQVGMYNPKISVSKYVVQPVDVFQFPREELESAKNTMKSAENPIDKDECFSETLTPQTNPPQKPLAMESRPALRSIENLQISSTARQFLHEI